MTTEAFARFRAEMLEAARALPENLVLLESVDSTNLFARALLRALPDEAYPPRPTFVIAFEQTVGRGRLGRRWWSPPGGGLYCTLVRPLDPPAGAPREVGEPVRLLPLAVAVAACGTVAALGVPACRIKWPNDLVVGGRKLGGILIEAPAGRARRAPAVVIGCGLNLTATRGEGLSEGTPATMEGEGASPRTPAEVLAEFAPRLRAIDGALASRRCLVADYRRLLAHRPGDPLRWRQGEEEVEVEGLFRRVDESGRLHLETTTGIRVVSMGDIIEPATPVR